jgi:hypothetical protein
MKRHCFQPSVCHLFSSSFSKFCDGVFQSPKIKNAHCQILSRQWAFGLARSVEPYMGGPPLPEEQGMGMPHMTIEPRTAFSNPSSFGSEVIS